MNWPKRAPIFKFAAAALVFVLSGCGVKGDPLPPERPPELGRGRPTYRRATENIRIQDTDPDRDEDDDKDEAKENGEDE